MEEKNEADFGASELGTKNFWDERYSKELESFSEMGDVGEIWFGENVQDKMVRWMSKKEKDTSVKVLDLGCGNGMLLIALREEGFDNLVGIDYSEGAIELAKKVAEKEEAQGIDFLVHDILAVKENCESCLKNNFNVCLDKGTYDAISLLNPDSSTDRDAYRKNVHSYLQTNGRFLITSCNWTKDQLLSHFKTDFDFIEELPSPTFSFGGKTGNTTTSIVFKKRINE